MVVNSSDFAVKVLWLDSDLLNRILDNIWNLDNISIEMVELYGKRITEPLKLIFERELSDGELFKIGKTATLSTTSIRAYAQIFVFHSN